MKWRHRPKSKWFHENSVLFKEVSAIPGVEVRVFLWSGDNSYLARYHAAAALASRLTQCDDPNDPPQQVIVAHSHGGNVALLASIHPNAPPIAGIATLATPFLNIKRRTENQREEDLLGYIQTATLLLLAATVMVLVFALVDVLDVSSSVDTTGSTAWPFADLHWMAKAALVGLLLVLGGWFQRVGPIRNAIARIRLWRPKRIAQWLILRAPGDEASRALDGARRSYERFNFIWLRLRATLAAVAPILKYRLPILFLLAPFAWASSVLATLARRIFLNEPVLVAWRHVVPNSGWFDVGAPFAVAVLTALLILGIFLFAAGGLIAWFGWELVTVGLAFEISAQETPPGDRYTVIEVSPTWQGSRHSLYESPEARALLVKWIERLPPAATGPDSRYWKIVT